MMGGGNGVRVANVVTLKSSSSRLRFGGSTSASTAGVLACQWNNAPEITSVQPGSRAFRPP